MGYSSSPQILKGNSVISTTLSLFRMEYEFCKKCCISSKDKGSVRHSFKFLVYRGRHSRRTKRMTVVMEILFTYSRRTRVVTGINIRGLYIELILFVSYECLDCQWSTCQLTGSSDIWCEVGKRMRECVCEFSKTLYSVTFLYEQNEDIF